MRVLFAFCMAVFITVIVLTIVAVIIGVLAGIFYCMGPEWAPVGVSVFGVFCIGFIGAYASY